MEKEKLDKSTKLPCDDVRYSLNVARYFSPTFRLEDRIFCPIHRLCIGVTLVKYANYNDLFLKSYDRKTEVLYDLYTFGGTVGCNPRSPVSMCIIFMRKHFHGYTPSSIESSSWREKLCKNPNEPHERFPRLYYRTRPVEFSECRSIAAGNTNAQSLRA